MTLNATAIFDAMVSYTLTTGMFEKVNTHEPKNKPGKGLTCAMWVQEIDPIGALSGLSSTSARLEIRQRMYSDMLSEPQDAIDPNLLVAVDVLFTKYHANFTLGGLVRNVDLLGAHGKRLSARAGYVNMDGKMMRVIDITVPLLINDLWNQTA